MSRVSDYNITAEKQGAAAVVAVPIQTENTGASDGIRTHDLLFTKQLLYP
jgi:uncharacterized protein YbjQ (UPF0145 family)